MIISSSSQRQTGNRSKELLRFLFTLFVILILQPNYIIKGQGNLLITPRRIVFEGSKRSMDINLANNGQDSANYVISVVQMKMKEDGGFENITEPEAGQRFADKYIRFFPRSVKLAPNEVQTLKVQLVRSNELTEGEYRSHFYFRAIPKVTALGEEEKQTDTTAISVKLTPIFGITIPVIIRSGISTTKVNLSDISFQMINDTLPNLKLVFNRTGNMSVYGDLAVDHISTVGKKTRVGIVNGIAVYTPNALRRFQFNLNRINGIDYRSGKLLITYSSPSDVKPAKFAEAELPLGN